MPSASSATVALITGAASGIGRATALAFAAEGTRLVLADIADEHGMETAALAHAAGATAATYLHCDVSQPGEVAALLARAIAAYGRLDCAVNNAGIEGAVAPTADYPDEAWHRVLAVNLTGVWLCLKHELPQMVAQDGGRIVNVSSVQGIAASAGMCAYAAAKHGVIGLTRSAAREYGRHHVRVNAVCPGPITTPMAQRVLSASGESADYVAASTALRRWATPAEVAATILWLCSDASSYVTGHALVVDGGDTLR